MLVSLIVLLCRQNTLALAVGSGRASEMRCQAQTRSHPRNRWTHRHVRRPPKRGSEKGHTAIRSPLSHLEVTVKPLKSDFFSGSPLVGSPFGGRSCVQRPGWRHAGFRCMEARSAVWVSLLLLRSPLIVGTPNDTLSSGSLASESRPHRWNSNPRPQPHRFSKLVFIL